MSKLNIQYFIEDGKDIHILFPIVSSDLALRLTLSGSNYPYLEQISMVPKMFEPLRFDCIYIYNERIYIYNELICRPRWLSWIRYPTGDQEVAGSTSAEVGNILLWRLIMKYFLRSFSPFR